MDDQLLSQRLATIQTQVHEQGAELIAVTKFVDSQTTRLLYEMGQYHLAENRSDKFLAKLEDLADIKDQITWHFIGHLQSRQVKLIINQIDYLHSLDRMSLAKEIQKRADHPIQCFLQVNVSGEESKGGFAPDQVDEAVGNLKDYDKIRLVGLMTMAPIDANEADLHHYFQTLKNLQVRIAERGLAYAPCSELSMGMTRDYPIALSEGATFIRLGRALFNQEQPQ